MSDSYHLASIHARYARDYFLSAHNFFSFSKSLGESTKKEGIVWMENSKKLGIESLREAASILGFELIEKTTPATELTKTEHDVQSTSPALGGAA